MTSRFRFTKKELQDLEPDKIRRFYYDQIVSSLAVLVTPSGAKSYYIIKNHKGVYHRERIGGVDELPIECARTIASEKIARIMSGKAPSEKTPSEPEIIMLQQSFAEYMTFSRAHRKPKTIHHYEYLWSKYLKSWARGKLVRALRGRVPIFVQKWD
jgi:hypothetical protein